MLRPIIQTPRRKGAHESGPQTYRILKTVVGSLGLDSVVMVKAVFLILVTKSESDHL
jgi:hypothetical protein